MTSNLKLIVWILSLSTLITSASRGDVLLDGKTPVDKGNGTMVGNEIRWTSCDINERPRTFSAPPYTLYKRANDCKGLPAGMSSSIDRKTPDPSVFGLNCNISKGAFIFGAEQRCTVDDQKLARYFFNGVSTGDKVTYETQNGKVKLTYGHDVLSVDASKWHDYSKASQFE